jgi:hypothetical protein
MSSENQITYNTNQDCEMEVYEWHLTEWTMAGHEIGRR